MGRKDNPVKKLKPIEGEPGFPWLWIGTWTMGGVGFGPHDETEAMKVLDRAISEGITHFDTAPVYGKGISEALLGRAVKRHRKRIFLCTKGGLRFEGSRVVHDGRPESLSLQLKQSMKRMKTDYIDLYLLHWPDPEVPLKESIDALKGLKKEGHIRHWGISNLSKEDILKCLSGKKDLPHQLHFSALCRDYELLRTSAQFCINCITSPLEQGLLSDSRVSEGLHALTRRDLRRRNPHFKDKTAIEWVRKLKELSVERS
ncbi:MAG: aldo/keto reductase, partial [Nitrospirae bacterium]